MTQINGKLNSSTFTGVVRFSADSPFIDYTTSPATLVSLPYEAPITNGAFTITVPQSQNLAPNVALQTEGQTYKIELFRSDSTYTFYLLDGTTYTGTYHLHTDSYYWTGSVHDASSKRLDRVASTVLTLIQAPIHAVIPNSGTAIDFSTLIAISTEKPFLDISAYRVAELLTTVNLYRDRISARFTVKGAYTANTYYVQNDLVSYNGSTYVYINATSTQNNLPPANTASPDTAYWRLIAAKGAAGGTGAQIVGYNPTNWAGSSEAAARGDVKDAIASIPNPDLSNYLTVSAGLPRANAVMTGSSKRAILTYPVAAAEKDTEIPTVTYVESAIAALTSGSKLPTPLIFAKRTSAITLGQDVRSVIAWNPRTINTGTALDTAGLLTIPEAGTYLFIVALQATITGNYQSSQGQVQIRYRGILKDVTNGVDLGNFWDEAYPASQATFTHKQFGIRLETGLSAGQQLQVDATTQAIGAASVISSSQIDGSTANNNFMVWKVS